MSSVREQFEAMLVRGGVPPPSASKFGAMIESGVRLESSRCDDADVAVGASKLGGDPDLAETTEWPNWKGNPLAFVAQINLGSLGSHSFCQVLPPTGLLSFFFDPTQRAWGFDPQHRGGWFVKYHADATCLERRAVPTGLTDGGAFNPGRLSVRDVNTLPASDSCAVRDQRLTARELDMYTQVQEQLEAQSSAGIQHQILGHPAQIQGDMQLDCQLASNGVNCGEPAGYKSARARALKSGASHWRLLAQFDTDEAAEMMWGDDGRIFFWITREDLAERRFENCWAILQCG